MQIDQLNYTYANRNQLSVVADAIANTNPAFQLPGITNYSYDVNGNMISRSNVANTSNDIAFIPYNQLNLPSALNANGAVINYTMLQAITKKAGYRSAELKQ